PLPYGHPTPGAGALAVSSWPVCAPSNIDSGPRQCAATMNSVRLSTPPSMQAKPPRSSAIDCKNSPPSRTRTQRLLGTSAYQTAPSASRQMPSGQPSPSPDAAVRQVAVGGYGEGG